MGAQVIISRIFGTNARAIAGVFFLCVLLGGCASVIPQTAELRDRWPADLPLRAKIEKVPFFPQVEYQCGPAALATALAYSGAAVTPDELVSQVYIPARKGTVTTEMLAAPRRYGRVSYQLRPRLEDVLREVSAGNPVVVFQNYGTWPFKEWHYAVIVAYNSHSGNLILRSGEDRERIEHIGIFEFTWKDGGRWAMVALSPERMPVTAEREPYRDAIVALERAGEPAAAARAYERFLVRWPEDLGATVGLANTQYALGDLARAEALLRGALARHPDSPVVLNNLAQTLSDLGRSDEALRVIERVPAESAYGKSIAQTRELILKRLERVQ